MAIDLDSLIRKWPDLPPEEEKLRLATGLTRAQWEVYNNPARFRVLVAGRRFGKCLEGDTLVTMASGDLKCIKNIVVGDVVACIDGAGNITSSTVTATAFSGEKLVYEIRTPSSLVRATAEHHFMVNDEWVSVRDAKAGDKIKTISNGLIDDEVLNITEYGLAYVYDIEVAKYHNFIANGVVSHNSFLATHELCRYAQSYPNGLIAYICPTLKQSKSLIWLQLKEAIPKGMIEYHNETSLELKVKGFNSRIKLFGADGSNAENMRGHGFNAVVLDEAADIDPGVWTRIIRPALSDKKGEALFIGTPKGTQNHLYDLYVHATTSGHKDWAGFSYTTADSALVDREELEAALISMQEWEFSQEYLASFTSPLGVVFPEFSRAIHVSNDAKDLGGPLLLGIDMNVCPYSICVASLENIEGDERLIIHDEFAIFGGHTQMAIEHVKRKYPDREIIAYPDASGRARKTSAGGATDFSLMVNAGWKLRAPSKNPPIRDRINTVKNVLGDGTGKSRILIHPRCKEVVRSFEGLTYEEGKSTPEKGGSGAADHMADAIGYLVVGCMPLVKRRLGMAKLKGV